MRKTYFLIGLAGMSMVLALLAGLIFSTDWAIDTLKAQAQARLGRSLSIANGVHIDFSPSLSLRFETVDVGNAEGLDGAFMSVKSVRIPVGFGDLLGRRLPDSFDLIEPRISFEINEKGDVSWAGPGKASGEATPVSFNIEKGTLAFFDHRNGQSLAVSAANLAVTVSPTGEINVNGNGVIGGRLVGLTAYLKSLSRVDTTGSPLDLSLDSPTLQASFNGRLATTNDLSLVGTAAVSGPSLRDVAKWAGTPIAGTIGFGRFSIAGPLESDGLDITMRGAEVVLDQTAATGDFGLSLGGDVPQVLGKLSLDTLDLNGFVAGPDVTTDDWGHGPLDYEGLRNIDGRVSLTTNRLVFGRLETGPTTIEASLAAGRLAAVITAGKVAGGNARADVEIDGSAQTPVFSLHLEGEGLDGREFLGRFLGIGQMSAPARLLVQVSGYGATAADVVSTLKGTASFNTGPGTIAGFDARGLAAAVTQRIVDGWQAGSATATSFTNLSAGFTIADGIAQTDNLALSADGLSVSGSGQVDLLRRAVNLSVTPRVASGAAAEAPLLPVPVIVMGPWRAPRVYPDVDGILKNPADGYARLRAMEQAQSPAAAAGN